MMVKATLNSRSLPLSFFSRLSLKRRSVLFLTAGLLILPSILVEATTPKLIENYENNDLTKLDNINSQNDEIRISDLNDNDESEGPITPIHEPGVCAIYSSCGKTSFFGPELPCPANIKAKDPDDETRKALIEVCGAETWSEGPICCDIGQVSYYYIVALLLIYLFFQLIEKKQKEIILTQKNFFRLKLYVKT